MFGTDLDTAYFDSTAPHLPSVTQPSNVVNLMGSGEYEAPTPSPPAYQPPPPPPPPPSAPPPPPLQPPVNPPSHLFPANPMGFDRPSRTAEEARIMELEDELAKKDGVSLYEKYLSKKKDVFKLLIWSLTILLAMSTHSVVSDLIRNYLNARDFSRDREVAIRTIYPLFVLACLWTLKVFNR